MTEIIDRARKWAQKYYFNASPMLNPTFLQFSGTHFIFNSNWFSNHDSSVTEGSLGHTLLDNFTGWVLTLWICQLVNDIFCLKISKHYRNNTLSVSTFAYFSKGKNWAFGSFYSENVYFTVKILFQNTVEYEWMNIKPFSSECRWLKNYS